MKSHFVSHPTNWVPALTGAARNLRAVCLMANAGTPDRLRGSGT